MARTPHWFKALTTLQQENYLRLFPEKGYQAAPHVPRNKINLNKSAHVSWCDATNQLCIKMSQEAYDTHAETWAKEHGWSVAFESTPYYSNIKLKFLTSPKGDIKIGLHLPCGYGMSGSTYFKTEKGWFCFDRLGISDSFFYAPAHHYEGEPIGIEARLDEQVKLVATTKEQWARSESFNMGPTTRTVTPEAKLSIIDRLKAGQVYTAMPHGFGTGYAFSTRFYRGARPASKALSQLVGKPVYYTTFDAD